ncbi:MAG: hypothetical protein JNL11_16620 [Bdellovibrionaceae bacterium]|nr:hypothetical protein [Pseudobdellovibrionaceae bacterium]
MRLQKKFLSIVYFIGVTFATILLFQNCNARHSFHSYSAPEENNEISTKRESQLSVSEPTKEESCCVGGSGDVSRSPSNTPPNLSDRTNTSTNQSSSLSGCASQLQSIGWSEKQDVTVETWAVDYDNFLVGVNQRLDRHAGFSVVFRSSIYTQPWTFRSRVEMPSGFGVRITDKATGQEIPIREDDLMGSPQYPSANHHVMAISTYKTSSQQGSHVSVAFRRLFFSRENLAFKTLKFDLLCDNKVIASGDKNMFTEPFSKNMLDVYLLDSTGAFTLTNREGASYRYILVDRSIDGGSLLVTCPTRANQDQTIACNLKSDTMSIGKWYIDNSYIQAHDDKQVVSLSNLTPGLHTVQVKGTSTSSYEVESNIVFVNIK